MIGGIYVGLGANLGEPLTQLRSAIRALDASDGVSVLRCSSWYRSPAWGGIAQPAFVNAVAEIDTGISAPALVELLLRIERSAGRERAAPRWGPRTLDLDLLLYRDVEIDQPGCRVPHPHLHERAFALVPLLELAPDILIAGAGAGSECLSRLAGSERDGVQILDADRGIEPVAMSRG
jgi:2-amino-4-hydroxy-6-hydroxymethyldihydropteridine diphosphokinase